MCRFLLVCYFGALNKEGGLSAGSGVVCCKAVCVFMIGLANPEALIVTQGSGSRL